MTPLISTLVLWLAEIVAVLWFWSRIHRLKEGKMIRASLITVVVLLVSVTVFAGTYLANDTGKTMYGLQIAFLEPVVITSFGDALAKVEPSGKSNEFLFSDGKVEVLGGQWFNWEPTEATLVSHQ